MPLAALSLATVVPFLAGDGGECVAALDRVGLPPLPLDLDFELEVFFLDELPRELREDDPPWDVRQEE
jgi:hypothetical protein